ncbi:MAG: hypothetical protein AAGJ95_07560, partial [Cyanobacteria bacterium J06554_11]
MKTDVSSRVVDQGQKTSKFTAQLGSRYTIDRIFKYAAWGATGISVVILALINNTRRNVCFHFKSSDLRSW